MQKHITSLISPNKKLHINNMANYPAARLPYPSMTHHYWYWSHYEHSLTVNVKFFPICPSFGTTCLIEVIHLGRECSSSAGLQKQFGCLLSECWLTKARTVFMLFDYSLLSVSPQVIWVVQL